MKIAALILCVVLPGYSRLLYAGEFVPYTGVEEQPQLALTDLAGDRHTLEEYRGKVVLVNFWATWCAPCLMEMPGIQRLSAAMRDRPFDILAVNVGDAREKVWEFANMLKLRFTMLLDGDGGTARAWNVQVYPASFLLDTRGRIRHVAYGALDWDDPHARRVIETLMPEPFASGKGVGETRRPGCSARRKSRRSRCRG